MEKIERTPEKDMMHARRELLRCFASPDDAVENLARIQRLCMDGLMDDSKSVGKVSRIEHDDLIALSWMADMLQVAHEIESLLDQHKGLEFEIGKSPYLDAA